MICATVYKDRRGNSIPPPKQQRKAPSTLRTAESTQKVNVRKTCLHLHRPLGTQICCEDRLQANRGSNVELQSLCALDTHGPNTRAVWAARHQGNRVRTTRRDNWRRIVAGATSGEREIAMEARRQQWQWTVVADKRSGSNHSLQVQTKRTTERTKCDR